MAVSGNAGFGAAVGSRGAAFCRWRRTRPFWGGFLLLLAGIELLLIPLSGILIHGAVKLVVYIGIGGVFGVLLGVLLIACGLLLWLNPAHRTFYAIAGVLLAVLSFIASNFGGFFIGMLLGIIGGSMGFAWTPSADQPTRRPLDPPRHGGRVMAAAVLPLLLAGTTLVATRPFASERDGASAAASVEAVWSCASSVRSFASAVALAQRHRIPTLVPHAFASRARRAFAIISELTAMTLSDSPASSVPSSTRSSRSGVASPSSRRCRASLAELSASCRARCTPIVVGSVLLISLLS